MNNSKFIDYDFNLPDHTMELNKAEFIIRKYQQTLKEYCCRNHITDNEHLKLFEETMRILNYLGKLSTPLFEIEDKLEEMYFKKYSHSPELAKKLWIDHYESIHHPYSLLKNRCFKLIDDLDELYVTIHKKNPPNWDL